MKKKEVRKGKTIFLSSNGYVEKVKVLDIYLYVSKHDDWSSWFFGVEYSDGFCSERSMLDCNIIKNGYNKHAAFFTPSAAYKHAGIYKQEAK